MAGVGGVVHGPLDRAQVTALCHGADGFVLPSVREPYGEPMAAGLPVVGWHARDRPFRTWPPTAPKA
jgi:hypothetical protein